METRDSAMTINERLWDAGLLRDFDAAVRAGDRAGLAAVLGRAGLPAADAEATADAVLEAPGRYGF